MTKNQKIALGVGIGVLVIGGVSYAIYQSNKNRREQDMFLNPNMNDGRITDPLTDMGMPTTDTGVPTPILGKPDLITKWQQNKDAIKSVCGRRKIIGKGKQEWLNCVEAWTPNSSFSGIQASDSFNYIPASPIDRERAHKARIKFSGFEGSPTEFEMENELTDLD